MKRLLCLAALGALSACSPEPSTQPPTEPVIDAPARIQSEPAVAASASPATTVTAAPAQGRTDRVECQTGEDRIFSCKTERGKRIAVCGTAAGKTEYRFGATKPELVLNGGRYASAGYSGGGEQQIAFDNGTARYVVFSRMVRTNFTPGETNDPAISDGVIVLRKDKVVSVLTCGGPDPDPMPVQTALAEKHMEQRSELFTYETERADPDWARE